MSGDNVPSLSIYDPTERHHRLAAWFLGPKAENTESLRHLIKCIVDQTEQARIDYQPTDPKFIDQTIQGSKPYTDGLKKLEGQLESLTKCLADQSIPFWSPRYNAHMTCDTSMPALLGYLATTFYNPNNVATEASPFTTALEKAVGLQLCEMLGYPVDPKERSCPWGHITCDGSIANLESMWAARNLKFYPLSLARALKSKASLASIRDKFKIELCNGGTELFSKLEPWDLLNLKPETVLNIPEILEKNFNMSSDVLIKIMHDHLIQTTGKEVLEKEFDIGKSTRYFVASTMHYSWPKGAAITGIGSENIQNIPIDLDARMDSVELDKLLRECLDEKRAVYAVVVIIGSTEHGAVDPIKDVVELRRKYQKRGLSFAIHADAAWGGYFASLLRDPPKRSPIDYDSYVPELALNDYTRDQLEYLQYADSITIDPHKSGYIPYPAGGLCYRDGRMRFLVTWLNPDVYKDSDGDGGMGVYGVEGSKPGAAPVAAWISHEVIGLHKDGYGSLLGEAMFSCVKMYTNWATMDMDDPYLIVVPLNRIPAEREGKSEDEIQAERRYILQNIVNRDNKELSEDEDAMKLVRQLGSDLSINAFVCNFRLNKVPNQDVVESNYLNKRIYKRLSASKPDDNISEKKMFIMSTTMVQDDYGACCTNLKERLHLKGNQDLDILVNCVMSPFPTRKNFMQDIVGHFKRIAHQEILNCLVRNTITEDNFRFVVQGTDKPYLSLLPMFSMANHRHQLILSCTFPPEIMEKYRCARSNDPSAVFYLRNTEEMTLDSMLSGQFDATLEKGLPSTKWNTKNFKVKDIKVVKHSHIDSKYLDQYFPEYMYFYLYGTKKQQHIEHMLVASSNAQLTSDQVVLSSISTITDKLSESEPVEGLILRLDDVHENLVLPIVPSRKPFFKFEAKQKFNVTIFRDPNLPNANGPGLTKYFPMATPITSGTMELGEMVHADFVLLNDDPPVYDRPGDLEVQENFEIHFKNNSKKARRTFIPKDPEFHPYYNRRDQQAAWSKKVDTLSEEIRNVTTGSRKWPDSVSALGT